MTQKYDYNKNKNEFTKEMLNDTLKYQKRYGFDISKNNVAWNNQADAFRHAYMQSLLNQKYSSIGAKLLSYLHEEKGSWQGQDPREANMDMWNNQQGQQIYNEIRREYPNFNKLSQQQQKDIIAQKVVQRMKAGKLITGLDDNRKYQEQKPNLPFTPTRGIGGVNNNGIPLGFASDIDISELLDELEWKTFDMNILQQKQQTGLFGYTNPLTGSNHIYTREEVGKMSPKEFAKHEKEIDAQTQYFKGTMPTNADLQNEANTNGGVVYVNSYTRSDGTKVQGYYRSR